jgi:predicted ATPase/class 3 adenylate cyclase
VPGLPSGSVTLLFTDIEGSTRLLQRLGDEYPAVLAQHQRILRNAVGRYGGIEVDTQGDSFFIVFADARDAIDAVTQAQRDLAANAWPEDSDLKVRMALHSGAPTLTGESYVGLDVHRAARLCASGHGGQVLVSQTTRDLVASDLPPGLELRDLGEHRLKDLQRAEEIFELVIPDLPNTFPPLRTLAARPNNLPRQTTPLVGRERELAETQERLLRPDVRLMTLTGPGGTGKTRLAQQLAAEVLEDFGDGVAYVALAPISDPALVASAIAQALGIVELAGRPLLETLRDYLTDKQLLLVLDNFEHLPSAAPLVGDLLAACPRLKVLVTSRAVLHVYGEHDYAVPPLGLPSRSATPSFEDLAQYEAVRLFVERAQAVKADFVVTARSAPAVAEICHRLDGLPLGIELAAARVRLLPPESMLVRMDRRLPLLTGGARDLPLRHQTLRSAIAWSFDLLGEPEQTLFRRLPVFAGGCTLEAAEAICGGWETGVSSVAPRGLESTTPDERVLAPVDVLDGVASLLDKSLLREEQHPLGEPRLLMLETIREYGLELIETSGEAAEVRRRHAVYYLRLAEEAEPKLHGPDQVAWLDRLESEHDNLGAVLSWSQAQPEGAETTLRLANALLWFWLVRGYYAEGRRAFEAALAARNEVSLMVRAKALRCAGHLTQYQRDFARSGQLLNESLDLARTLGDRHGVAATMSLLGETARFQADFGHATDLLEESLTLQQELGDRWASYHTLYRLGEAARDQGLNARATALHEESLTIRRAFGDTRGIAASLQCLGLLAVARGDSANAASILKEGLATHRATRNKLGISNCLEGLAGVALAQNRPAEAACLLGAIEAILETVGGSTLQWGARARYERDRDAARAELDPDTFAAAWAEGRAMGLEHAVEYALDDAVLR